MLQTQSVENKFNNHLLNKMIIKLPNFTRSYADLEIVHGKTLKTPFIFSFVLFVATLQHLH